MNTEITDMLQAIGAEMIGIADDAVGKIMLFSEGQEGMVTAELFYIDRAERLRYRYPTFDFTDLIYSFWERWQEEPGNREWRMMSYLIDEGKFTVEMAYPDQIDPDADLGHYRQLAVEKIFGDQEVDYSDPGEVV